MVRCPSNVRAIRVSSTTGSVEQRRASPQNPTGDRVRQVSAGERRNQAPPVRRACHGQPVPAAPRLGRARATRCARGSVNTIDALREALGRLRPDVAVVDVGLAAGRRSVALELVRGAGTPLIAVAVTEPAARVELLLAGADDCLPAAYTSAELAARVIALGRRTRFDQPQRPGAILRAGPLQLDLRTRRVEVHGSEVTLTAMEFSLLSCFLRNRGEALSRERLLARSGGIPAVQPRRSPCMCGDCAQRSSPTRDDLC